MKLKILEKIKFFVILFVLIFSSCATEDVIEENLLSENTTIEVVADDATIDEIIVNKEIVFEKTNTRNFYIPPGATVTNLPATFNGCINYTSSVSAVLYQGAISLTPAPDNYSSSTSLYLEIVVPGTWSVVSTLMTGPGSYVFLNSSTLNGGTSFYWRLRLVNSSCFPNPTNWTFTTL
jgi:hypothetical protein